MIAVGYETSSSNYNPDGFCRACCLEKILCHFNCFEHQDDLTKIKSTLQTIKCLLNNSLNYFIYIPLISLCSPIVCYLYVKELKNTTTSINIFTNKLIKIDNKIILHHLSFYQLYKIKEHWTHCVLEIADNDECIYFDPLVKILIKQHELEESYKPPTAQQLLNYTGIKIAVWR